MPHALIQTIDAFVKADPGLPGFEGRLSIVVLGAERTCWHAAFTKTEAGSEILDVLPMSSDAVLILDEDQADSVLGSHSDGPRRPIRIQGDPTICERFLERYFTPRSWLQVQA